MSDPRLKADQIMEQAIQTYRDRLAIYGNNAKDRHGEVMASFFPNGYTLGTADDFARFSIFNMIIAKLVRYTNDFDTPHQDSIHDVGVYAFVLEEMGQE